MYKHSGSTIYNALDVWVVDPNIIIKDFVAVLSGLCILVDTVCFGRHEDFHILIVLHLTISCWILCSEEALMKKTCLCQSALHRETVESCPADAFLLSEHVSIFYMQDCLLGFVHIFVHSKVYKSKPANECKGFEALHTSCKKEPR